MHCSYFEPFSTFAFVSLDGLHRVARQTQDSKIEKWNFGSACTCMFLSTVTMFNPHAPL
jgi:hypothetical protein